MHFACVHVYFFIGIKGHLGGQKVEFVKTSVTNVVS